MSCKDCLNRREFLAKSAMAAAALAAIEGCGDGQIGPTAVDAGAGLTIKVSDFPGLANVGTLVDIGHARAVMRTGTSTFTALSKICTHEGCETAVTNNRFECPCHSSIFASDGSVVRGPIGGGNVSHLQVLDARFDATANTLTVS
jgi:Rieske Fe-S protein